MQQYQEALRDYNKAIKLNPHEISYYKSRGQIYYILQKHQAAIDDFTTFLNVVPKAKIYNFLEVKKDLTTENYSYKSSYSAQIYYLNQWNNSNKPKDNIFFDIFMLLSIEGKIIIY